MPTTMPNPTIQTSPHNTLGSPSPADTTTAIIDPHQRTNHGDCIATLIAGATTPTIGTLHSSPQATWLQPLDQTAPINLNHGHIPLGVVRQILHTL